MGYEIYSEHPDSRTRRAEDFSAWSLWSAQNAPWTGVSISDMAKLVGAICSQPLNDTAKAACLILDLGGLLNPVDAREVFSLAGSVMNEKVRQVFHHAIEHGYPVRVVFSKGFGSLTASVYLAKQSSA